MKIISTKPHSIPEGRLHQRLFRTWCGCRNPLKMAAMSMAAMSANYGPVVMSGRRDGFQSRHRWER